jgi:hypothetical protein
MIKDTCLCPQAAQNPALRDLEDYRTTYRLNNSDRK